MNSLFFVAYLMALLLGFLAGICGHYLQANLLLLGAVILVVVRGDTMIHVQDAGTVDGESLKDIELKNATITVTFPNGAKKTIVIEQYATLESDLLPGFEEAA